MSESTPRESPEKFVPRGAIAFFALLIFIGLVIWFGIYFVMLARS
ncbi:cytochrome c oxidase subunit 2A [Chitinophaga caseinilytica]|uniref:Cytochrome c oxidase subunit 2A n=1 Tax=Chitinophaga caseinilytica TaxID=2267521 RepID=A0ABZ2Z668_9BACT